jgi:hypothetical protein
LRSITVSTAAARFCSASLKKKPEILKAYLDRFKLTVQRYFPVRAGSNPQAFAEMAQLYPVFELLPFNQGDIS